MTKAKTLEGGGLSYHLPGILGFLLSFTAVLTLVLINQDRILGMLRHSQQMSANISSSAALTLVNPAEEVRPAAQPPAPALAKKTDKAIEENSANNEDAKNSDADIDDRDDQETFLRKFRNGKNVKMTATAYCLNNVTASGVKSKYGIVAADPKLLPIGSIIQIEADQYSGLYTVLDTGELIKGRKIDIYLAN